MQKSDLIGAEIEYNASNVMVCVVSTKKIKVTK